MAHFWSPSSTQIIPRGVVYHEKSDEPHAPHEVWKIDIPTKSSQVPVNLWGAGSLKVTSNNPSVIANPIPETADGDHRVLRLAGATAGTSMIEATDSDGNHWSHLQVHVVDPQPTRAGPSGPSMGYASADAQPGGASAPEPVAELLGLIDKKFTDAELANTTKSVAGFLNARKVANVVKVFLHAYRALAGRKLPTRNAIFLPCHIFEAGFGASGPNASIGNWFSVQVLPIGNTELLFHAYERRGITPVPGERDNAGKPSSVFNPDFRMPKSSEINIADMVNMQLDLQYGAPLDASAQPWVVESVAPWKSIGRALARTDITARQFGGVIGGAGYANQGSDYGRVIAGSYDNVSTALKWFLGGPLSGASETAKAWAAAALAEAAPKG